MPEYELNLKDYLRIFHKRKFVMLTVFLAVAITSAVNISLQPRIYETFATVKIMERQNIAGILTEWIVYTPADIMKSQAEIIRGFPIMKKVALRFGLLGEGLSPSEIQRIVVDLQGRMSTETITQTNIIRITASGTNPKETAELANTVAEVYVEENLLEKRRQASSTRQFIEEQLAQLEKRLEEGEDALRETGDKAGNVRLAGPIQQRLIDMEFTLAGLLQKYTDKHPEVIQTKEQIKDLQAQLGGFSNEELVYARLMREVEVNKKLYAMLKEKLEEARITEAQKIGDVSIVDPASVPSYPVSPRTATGMLLGGFLGLLLGALLGFIIESLDTSIRTVEDMEAITKLRVLGVLPSLADYIEEKKGNIFDRILARFFPARRKYETKGGSYVSLAVYHEPKSQTAEAYRNIRTNLKLSPSLKTILVTSAGPREGKTTIVTNLGLTIALSGEKTLLVSSDLRRPELAKIFGLAKEPGLSEVITKVAGLDEGLRNIVDMFLSDNMDLEKIINSPGIENVSVFPEGRSVDNPAELLKSKEALNLFSELKNKFDMILFDSPPALPITDASLLAPMVDGVVLVYEAGTTRNALIRAKAQLESAGAKILGVVLNHIKPEAEVAASYPYYYKYRYYYYGEKPDEKSKPFWRRNFQKKPKTQGVKV